MKTNIITASISIFIAITIYAAYVSGYYTNIFLVFLSFLLAIDAFALLTSYNAFKETNFNFRKKFLRRALTALLFSLVWSITPTSGIDGYIFLINIILFTSFYNLIWDFWLGYWTHQKTNGISYWELVGFGWIFKGIIFIGATVLWWTILN